MTVYAKRRDANERLVITALEAVGASVMQLDGKGVPDLLVGYNGHTTLIEVKNPESKSGAKPGEIRRKGRGVLKSAQVKSFAAWKGGMIFQVINGDEALVAIGALRPAITPAEVADALEAGAKESDSARRATRRAGRYF